MKTVTAKIKTAAIAAALVAGIAGGAAAQGTNPFVNGQIPNQNTPNVKTSPNEGNPYANPNQGNQFGNRTSMDSRLARFLVGTWQGRLGDGKGYRVRFTQKGTFALAQHGADMALVGRYRVVQGKILFRVHARCNLATRQCQRLGQPKLTTVAFRPVDRQTLQVREGYMRRVG